VPVAVELVLGNTSLALVVTLIVGELSTVTVTAAEVAEAFALSTVRAVSE
jgi:hypothetical protein